jgi:allantoate deiminase
MTEALQSCVKSHGIDCASLPSGAGHDAAVLAKICPVAMLFVRCKGGISHNPAESVKQADVSDALGVLVNFIEMLGRRHA